MIGYLCVCVYVKEVFEMMALLSYRYSWKRGMKRKCYVLKVTVFFHS